MSNILIPIINIDVYHMTTTGKDKETLKSFLSTGANPNSSTGNDQGRGLYVWTSKEAAIQRSLSEQNLKEGYPLLITLNVDLNPGEWFIDTEVHSKLAGELIFESWETAFKRIPGGIIETPKGMLVPSQSQKTKLGTMMFKFGLNPPYRSIGLSPSRESNIGAGQIFGPILEYIEHNFPEIIELFRFQVFQEVKRGQAFALRYVGKKNIPVKRYEILKERKWIDGMTLLS